MSKLLLFSILIFFLNKHCRILFITVDNGNARDVEEKLINDDTQKLEGIFFLLFRLHIKLITCSYIYL